MMISKTVNNDKKNICDYFLNIFNTITTMDIYMFRHMFMLHVSLGHTHYYRTTDILDFERAGVGIVLDTFITCICIIIIRTV